MEAAKPCDHFWDETIALEVVYVLDAHISLTDAFAKCRHCRAHYLIETFDMRGSESALRVSSVPSDYAENSSFTKEGVV